MKHNFIIFITVLLAWASLVFAADDFTAIKLRLAQAPAVKFYFQSITESVIFESVDSLEGTAIICHDGRYRAEIGSDVFIYDGHLLFSYSPDNNQLVIEKPAEASAVGEEITFLTKLHEYYESITLVSGEKYRLYRLAEAPSSLPDSLILHINGRFIDEISFFDLNLDLNRIAVDTVVYLDYCDSLVFIPDFPDSTETVKLY